MNRKTSIATAALAAALAAGPAWWSPAAAQQDRGAAWRACAEIESDEARLECFDRVARGPDADADERAEFGLEPTFEGPQRMTVLVVDIGRDLSDKAVFATEDGQIWRQTSRQTRRYEEPPFAAEIERAALDSHFLRPLSGGPAVRVRRLE